MAIVPEDFLKDLDIDEFDQLNKEGLITIGNFLGLPVKKSMRKAEIRSVLVKQLIKNGLLDDSASSNYVTVSVVELKRIELQTQVELRKLELEHEKIMELEKSKLKYDLEMKKLEARREFTAGDGGGDFDVTKYIRFVPPFQEDDVDRYFLHFEKMAHNLKWPKEFWPILLQGVLVGKAREIFTQLSLEQASDYAVIKETVLKGYELVPEAYRQRFRNACKESSQTYMEFARVKEQLFDRWCVSKKVESLEGLRQLILIEEFKRCVSRNVKMFIDERRGDTLNEIARLSDDYSLTHQENFSKDWCHTTVESGEKPSNVTVSQQIHVKKSSADESNGTNNLNPKSNVFVPPKTFMSSNRPMICGYCKKEGHLMSDCFKLKRKQAQNEKSIGIVASLDSNRFGGSTHIDSIKFSAPNTQCQKMPATCDMAMFEPFIFNGFLSLSSDMFDAVPIRILRDTGASQSLVLAEILPFSETTFSGTNVLIKGIASLDYSSIPIHDVHLSSDLVTGPISVGVNPCLPFEGIHFLLGNDLAGNEVRINPLVANEPLANWIPDPMERDNPCLYPACAVTRSMSCEQNLHGKTNNTRNLDNVSTIDSHSGSCNLSDSFMKDIFDEQQLFENSSRQLDLDQAVENNNESTSQLVKEQHSDLRIRCLFHRVVDDSEIENNPVCFYIRNGVLMRKWRSASVPANHEWTVIHQIVVPESYRFEILALAHEGTLAGHLGVNKTYRRILNHFYWPKLKKDVAEFCRSCHTCQMVGKPNQVIPRAPLHPIPVSEEPFSRLLIDCVGPLPKTKTGNQYILTMMCVMTRFPEAVPLRNIKTRSIVKALIKFFTLFGLPKSIQSDQGSNFMSGVFQQVLCELGVKQFRSSAYHPESQGAIERFHQTMKTMIRSYCFETGRFWDEGIDMLMFAARESIQESLGFSPFELIFGHSIRGPLKLLKEKFLSDENEVTDLLQYVLDFRSRLTQACEVAKTNLKSSQRSMKGRYDLNAVDRNFKSGDQVLALLPIPGRPLQTKFFGPYVVEQKIGDLNYVLLTPDRRKRKQLCHINMLKPYIDRQDVDLPVKPVASIIPSKAVEDNDSNFRELNNSIQTPKLQNSDIMKNLESKLSHLQSNEKQCLVLIIDKYQSLFPDIPTRTNLIYHDVDVGDSQPIKQHPYRLNPQKKAILQREVTYLLENDFIERSNSCWSSPCILVPKPDGTYRMCTDYRKVNVLTKTDSFPIPRVDDCIDNIGNSKFVTKFDLLKGFWQVPLSDQAKEISAFVTPDGLFQYKVMPFGMKNAPATFQRLMNTIIAGLKGCEAYIDDVLIYSNSWEEHLQMITEFFDRLIEANLTINLAKSEFGRASVIYLGYVVGQGQVKPVDAKITAICNFPKPENKKQLMRFLGMAGYYRKFCRNFATITDPLTNLLRKRVLFVWSHDCDIAFEKLKAFLSCSPVLLTPNFNAPFIMTVDASETASGAVLLQKGNDFIEHPICYFSRKFNKSQQNYSTIEKECLALILALQHFEVYVTSSTLPILVYSDHNPLVFIQRLRNKNQRLMRWSLLLQEYNLEIRHIKGKDNLLADALSRI